MYFKQKKILKKDLVHLQEKIIIKISKIINMRNFQELNQINNRKKNLVYNIKSYIEKIFKIRKLSIN